MKFYYCSDLHLDNFYNQSRIDKYYYPPALTADIKEYKKSCLIIAGDFCVKNLMYRQLSLINEICSKFKHVFYVEGNHENYKWNMSIEYDYSNMPKNFHVLNNSVYELNDIIVYGGTMWANLSDISNLDKFNISSMINDFRIIYSNETDLFSIDDSTSHYNVFIENLYEAQINAESKNKKLIVVSHFAPSMKSVTPEFKGDPLNPYFCNEIDDLIENSDISAWVHGHVHSNHDYRIGNTRILCNPRGYPSELNKFKLKHFKV